MLYYFYLLFFFFSSRRRHTRCLSDWSSDVCSSDLRKVSPLGSDDRRRSRFEPRLADDGPGLLRSDPQADEGLGVPRLESAFHQLEIGRASCRERVWISGVVGW